VSIALFTQHAKCMRHIAICVASVFTIFSTLSRKRRDLGGKEVIGHKTRVLTFAAASV